MKHNRITMSNLQWGQKRQSYSAIACLFQQGLMQMGTMYLHVWLSNYFYNLYSYFQIHAPWVKHFYVFDAIEGHISYILPL